MSLARLWQRQGQTKRSSYDVAEIYGWFTEDLNTKDCQRPSCCWRNSHEKGISSSSLPTSCTPRLFASVWLHLLSRLYCIVILRNRSLCCIRE